MSLRDETRFCTKAESIPLTKFKHPDIMTTYLSNHFYGNVSISAGLSGE